jgi:hypothetical protein
LKVSFLGIFLSLAFSVSAQARVFSMSKETFAGYFSVSGGSSALGDGAFAKEASGVTYNSKVNYNYGGEFGVVYARPGASLRFGIEIVKPQLLDNVSGSNSTTEVYTLKSDVMAIVPKITLDVNLEKSNTHRSFMTVYGGYANVTVKNDYTLTTAGTAAYPGMDTAMEAKGTGTELGGSIGYEGFLNDSTTYLFEAGYRSLKVDNLKYSKDANLFGTAHSSGDAVNDSAGAQRALDLGGFVFSLGFRFYL